MKAVFIVLSVLFINTDSAKISDAQLTQNYKIATALCKDITDILPVQYADLLRGEYRRNRSYGAFIICLGYEMGVVSRANTVHIAKLKEITEKYRKMDPEKYDRMMNIVEKCVAEVPIRSNKYKFGEQLLQCAQQYKFRIEKF